MLLAGALIGALTAQAAWGNPQATEAAPLILAEKSAMLKWEEPESTDNVRHRSITASCESLRVPHSRSRACLSRWFDHRFAILVNQGSDPTVPYQALVIRESARLFLGFAPWGQ
jgi:hypothetical protein